MAIFHVTDNRHLRRLVLAAFAFSTSARSNFMSSGYQPLAQSIDEEANVGDSTWQGSSPTRGSRRAHRPGPIDLSKLDNAFKR
jgi:hypothetical protein